MTAIQLATFRAKPHPGDAMAAGLPAAAGVIADAHGSRAPQPCGVSSAVMNSSCVSIGPR